MKYKTKQEAANRLLTECFDYIPSTLLERAFRDDPASLALLAGGQAECPYCGYWPEGDELPKTCPECEEDIEDWYFTAVYAWPAAWGSLFHPRYSFEEDRIRADPKGCAEAANVLVYDSDETGILLAVDGAGYDFYEAHWIPLYEWLGYEWHEEEE